ncbi:dynamin family protein [Murimonas intestini]|uniref:Dynamin family protein n=1 Tax=Murimonas intestini TaxID=1337051 RepID=A0AB73T1E6_9FIRM|nr:dynamin family protein [Murimonas intestini]MCR1840378.1 dynamin family protein [Murimonas intestini]MCR1867511.1 dynamin family protein [Murimonas intestini]MCR1884698.1 dynamin family protein [Murimonas intestini]
MENYKDVEQLRNEVTAKMDAFARLLHLAGMDVEAGRMEDKSEEFRAGLFQVLFTGVFNGGKSTLLNALMRQKMLRTSINPETAVITKIANGDSGDEMVITFKDGKRPDEKISVTNFFEKYRVENGNEHKYEEIDYVTVHRKMPNKTVMYVDSPGLNNTGTEDRIAKVFSAKADAIVFMINATNALNQNERQYVQKNFERRSLRNVFFVVNWWNMVTEESTEEFQKRVFDELHEVFTDTDGRFDEELYRSRVFFVDAYTSECARTGMPKKERKGIRFVETPVQPEDDEYTGVPEFETALNNFLLSSDADKEGYKGYLPQMAAMYKATAESINAYGEEAGKSVEELEKRLREQEKTARELKRTINGINQAFDSALQEILVNISSSYDGFVRSVDNNWEEYFANQDVKFGMKQEGKIVALKVKYWGQDLIGRFKDKPQGQEDKMARDEEFRKIVAPIVDAINGYIRKEAEKMAHSAAAASDGAINRMTQTIMDYCENIKDLSTSGMDGEQILRNIALSANVDIGIINGKANLGQLLVGIVFFRDFDNLFTDMVSGKSWGDFIKDALVTTITEYCIATIVSIFTGTYLIYLIARALWGLLRINKNAQNIGKKIIMSSKGETVQTLKNEHDSFAIKMENKFGENLGRSRTKITGEFMAQIEQKERQLKNLLESKRKKDYDSKTELKRLNGIKEGLMDNFNDLGRILLGRGFSESDILEWAVPHPAEEDK